MYRCDAMEMNRPVKLFSAACRHLTFAQRAISVDVTGSTKEEFRESREHGRTCHTCVGR
jgi:hypothetical protein